MTIDFFSVDTDKFDLKHPFWDKISLFYGDITKINVRKILSSFLINLLFIDLSKVDAIVNCATSRLDGEGGSLNRAVHSAAGYEQLQTECRKVTRVTVYVFNFEICFIFSRDL